MTIKQEIKSGTVVRLRSGGPVMTVSSDGDSNVARVICQWFIAEQHLQQGAFHMDALEIIPNNLLGERE